MVILHSIQKKNQFKYVLNTKLKWEGDSSRILKKIPKEDPSPWPFHKAIFLPREKIRKADWPHFLIYDKMSMAFTYLY